MVGCARESTSRARNGEMHVHVQGQGGEAKFWLEPSIELAQNYGLGQASLRVAKRLIEEREDEIGSAWDTHFRR